MDESEAIHKKGYHPASNYDRCLKRIEHILRNWKISDKEHSPDEVVEILRFAYCKFILTRYRISGISTDNGIEKDFDVEAVIPKSQKGGRTLSQQKEMPKALLDMLDESNMFPRREAHHFHKCYGLKSFIVMSRKKNEDIPFDMTDMLLNMFSFVALKCQCQLPLFVKYNKKSLYPLRTMNPGILKCPGFRASFNSWEGHSYRYTPDVNLKFIIETFKDCTMYQFQGPAKVYMTFTCNIDIRCLDYYPCQDRPCDMISTIDFGIRECERLWYYKKCPKIEFYLNASWPGQLDTKVIRCEANDGFNLLDAPKWSFRVDIADTEVPLGDCLKSFLSLCSSTQTESLLSNPEIFSMLKYRRIYKHIEEVNSSLTTQGLMEPNIRKVISKLTLKPEESFIPVESLNAILDFLFHDAKLQPPQHSNGTDPSATTAVEDEVEDNFYLSYKELSKYFKSTRPSSLMSRLAICLCIVNKYHGGLGAVNQLWGEFVLEMKYCLENNCEIKGLEPVEPKLEFSKLLQKLQMLNRLIKKKRARYEASPATSTTIEINTLNFKEFMDISELPLERSIDLSKARVGSSTSEPLLRVKMLFNRLLAMDAFYAANPGCALGDFVRWCSDEDWMEELVTDEGKDKITNKNHYDHPNQWIQISDNVSLVFHKIKREKRFSENDAAAKVLHWLALVKPSDLVLKLIPNLIFSAVTKLLEHPVCQLAFLREHLIQFRNKLVDQSCNEACQCTSSEIKMLEDYVHHLALIEQKMAGAQYLLKAFRYVDPSCMVSDAELEKYVSNLVEIKEIPINTSRGELPSKTRFGKLIYKLFHDYQQETKECYDNQKNEDSEVEVYLKPLFREYILLERSKTTGSYLRLHGIVQGVLYKFDAAFTDEPQSPME